MPRFPKRYLSKIVVSSYVYPKFRCIQLPSDSVNFRWLPFSLVLCNLDYMLYGRGRGPKSLLLNLAKIAVLSAG